MKIYNESKTIEITSPDLSLGRLVEDRLFVAHHEAIPAVIGKTSEELAKEMEAQGAETFFSDLRGLWYYVDKKFDNGGRSVKAINPVRAVPEKEAWDEYEDIYVYIPYTEEELLENKKNSLREERKTLLEAFDKWEKAVLRGREKDDSSIMNWYRDLLNLVESAFLDENVPEMVRYYLGR